MGNLERLQILRDFIAEEPENPFNYYALALELRENQPDEATKLFDHVLEKHPDYLAAYFPSAHFFAELNEIAKAQQLFEKGIALATLQQNHKAGKELQNAYQNFLFENDLE